MSDTDYSLLAWVIGDLTQTIHLVALYTLSAWYALIKASVLITYLIEHNKSWRHNYLWQIPG